MKLITQITPLKEIQTNDEVNQEWFNGSSNSVVGIPEDIQHPCSSLLYTYYDTETHYTVALLEFLLTDMFREPVEKYRKCKSGKLRERIKKNLPCITPSGIFDNRSKNRLYHLHSGYICIDIDGKDNPQIFGIDWFPIKKQLMGLFNSLMYAGMSIGGNGLCLVFRIAYPEKHNEHFNALVAEIREKTGLVADESCRGVARLRGASYDAYPACNFYPKPYLMIKHNIYPSNNAVPLDRTAREQNLIDEKVKYLVGKISKRKIDITSKYKDWYKIGCAFAAEYGKEEGLRLFHRVSMWYPEYHPAECDRQFNQCLRYGTKTNITSFFKLCKSYGVTFK